MDGVAKDHLAQIAASFTIHPDFPIKGVSFRNILPVMRDPQLFGWLIDACVAKIKDKFPAPIDLIVGLEARGFLFGPAIALRLNCGFVAIRKPGKLPGKLATVTFRKEYGEDVFEIEEDAIKPGQRVVIVDDVLATGGTLRAATQLMEQRKALPVGTFVIVELLGLGDASLILKSSPVSRINPEASIGMLDLQILINAICAPQDMTGPPSLANSVGRDLLAPEIVPPLDRSLDGTGPLKADMTLDGKDDKALDLTRPFVSHNTTVVRQATGNDRLVVKYVLSSLSAFVAEFATYPLDLAKTRLQIQGERGVAGQRPSKGNQPYRGLMKTAVGIVEEEGFFKLWYGLSPALVRHAIYTGSRMTLYEKGRELVFHADSKDSIALWQAVILGMSCGGLSQVLANPTDVVKVMLQMEGRRRLEGKPPRVTGMVHAFKTVIVESGYRGLMRGWAPNMQRAALVNLGDLTAYDTIKHAFILHTPLKDTPVTHALSSLFSGIVAATFATPADVVKTRMMNQPFDEKGRPLFYKSSMECLSKTIRDEGLLAIYKGFFPAWMRMGPWSMTFWMVYEQLRRLNKPVAEAPLPPQELMK